MKQSVRTSPEVLTTERYRTIEVKDAMRGCVCVGFLHLALPGVLFNVFALIVTLWVLIAGVLVSRAPGRRAVELVESASPA